MQRNYSFEGERNFHVTLIRPPSVSAAASFNISSLTPPLALAYLSAALIKNKFSVTNIDAIGEGLNSIYRLERNPNMEAQGLTPSAILARIPPHTNMIGISCMFSLEWPATRDLITLIRKEFPKTFIVIGGEHASALPEFNLIDCPAIDAIVLGEGENILVDLANRLEHKESFANIPGIIYKQDGKIIKSQGCPESKSYDGASGNRIKNLDDLLWPAWHLTPLSTYLNEKLTFGRLVGLTMPILGSRGCPYECTFCSNPKMWGRRYITRSAKDVVDEIVFYKNKYQITAIEFYDLTPIVKKSWIIEFCNELIDRKVNIKWQISGGTRCEAIDEEVILKAKESGCEYIGFAPESGVQAVLDRIKKKIKISHMLDLIRLAKKNNVSTRCNIIIGFPEDSRWQIIQSLFFQIKLAYLGVTDCPVFDFTPYPGSEIFEQLREQKIIPTLNDQYFESLGINVQIANRRQYCKAVGPKELFFYRMLGMFCFYSFYYICHPLKAIKFIKNIFVYKTSNSVFEQRIIQNIRKQFKKNFINQK